MNYIKQLQRAAAGKDAEIKYLQEGLADLLSYVQSSKFYTDTTVQVGDIILRVREIQSGAPGARETAESEFVNVLSGRQ